MKIHFGHHVWKCDPGAILPCIHCAGIGPPHIGALCLFFSFLLPQFTLNTISYSPVWPRPWPHRFSMDNLHITARHHSAVLWLHIWQEEHPVSDDHSWRLGLCPGLSVLRTLELLAGRLTKVSNSKFYHGSPTMSFFQKWKFLHLKTKYAFFDIFGLQYWSLSQGHRCHGNRRPRYQIEAHGTVLPKIWT